MISDVNTKRVTFFMVSVIVYAVTMYLLQPTCIMIGAGVGDAGVFKVVSMRLVLLYACSFGIINVLLMELINKNGNFISGTITGTKASVASASSTDTDATSRFNGVNLFSFPSSARY